jgi:ankyrin repeat protein
MTPAAVKKVDVNAIDKSGETALIRESRIGDTVFVRSLLEKGADVNISDPYGYTALIYASRYGYVHVVKLLTENGANLDACA